MHQCDQKPFVGLVLAGCGQWDGTDIHEAVLTLLSLDQAGATAVCTAPDLKQLHVLNHMSHEEMAEVRHMAVESARLACGNFIDLNAMSAEDLDAVILPGGHGAIKNLSDFAVKGPSSTVYNGIHGLLEQMNRLKKPIGATSAAAIVVANALRAQQPCVTIGSDMATASAIETMGAVHQPCQAGTICVDKKNRIVTTPGNMAGTTISQVAAGVEKMVRALISMIDAC